MFLDGTDELAAQAAPYGTDLVPGSVLRPEHHPWVLTPSNKAPHWTQQTGKGVMAQRGKVSWQRPHTGKRWSWGLNPGFPPW